LRNKAIHVPNSGIRWPEAALFSLVVEISQYYDVANDSLNGLYPALLCILLSDPVLVEEAASIIARYNNFVEKVEQLGLYEVGDAAPLIDVRCTIK